MTYDLYSRRAETLGADPESAFATLLEEEPDDEPVEQAPRRPTPAERAVLEEVIAALLRANPQFELVSSPRDSTWVQLDDQRTGGLLVDVEPEEVGATVSYGTDDPAGAARNVCVFVRAMAEVGWVAYDPQLERVVTGTLDDERETAALIAEVSADLRARYGPRRRRGLLERLLGR